MAIKTISLEIDAYEKLRQAKRGPRESFSQVVRRARWDDQPPTAKDLLRNLHALAQQHPDVLLPEEMLRAIECRRRTRHRFRHR